MKKLTAKQPTLFALPKPLRVCGEPFRKQKLTETELKQARRRWRVTYQLRKRGVEIRTSAREISVSGMPSENPTKRWVDELVEINKFHVQFIIK